MLSQRYTRLVTTLLMSMVMVTLMTLIVTAINTGLTEGFMSRWGKAILIAWPVAFPLIYILPKRMQMLAGRICSLPN